MVQPRQHAVPMYLAALEGGDAVGLRQVTGTASATSADSHNEAWLQDLIHAHPEALPIGEIEPALTRLLPVCRELPTDAGFVDNVFLTPRGDIVVAECKLWRNPQARREVVAQALDYAASLSRLDYERFERIVGQALKKESKFRLFGMLEPELELSEAEFVDAVGRNLRLGRMLLLIIGDGIREGMETLGEYLQRHAGLHFTLSLVELPVFQLPEGGFVVLPRIVAKTTNIERGVITMNDSRVTVEEPRSASGILPAKRVTMSDNLALEQLAAIDQRYPRLIDQFLAATSDLGVYSDSQSKSLGFYWRGPNEKNFNLGGISISGELLTDSVNWKANEAGLVEISHRYQQALADIVGGYLRKTPVASSWYVAQHGTMKPSAMSLLSKGNAWPDAVRAYLAELRAALAAESD